MVMKKKKALLIVAGGRIMPDILSLVYVQPDVVVYLTSEQGWSEEKAFLKVAEEFPFCKSTHAIRNVSAYKFDKAVQA